MAQLPSINFGYVFTETLIGDGLAIHFAAREPEEEPLSMNPTQLSKTSSPTNFLSGGGEMGALMRANDWTKTSLGAVETWSPTLRSMVSFLLANPVQMLLLWGFGFCQFYNDAFQPCLGAKHPRAMGQPASECWAEIWHIIGPLIETPYRGGEATRSDQIFWEIHRHGFAEETFWDIAYSPVPDETAPNGIGGVAATVREVTEKVVRARRSVVRDELGTRLAEARTAEEACRIAAETLAQHPRDIPFALIYLANAARNHVRLVGIAGIKAGNGAASSLTGFSEEASPEKLWPLAEASRSRGIQIVDDLQAKLPSVPPGPWSDPPRSAVVCPIPSNIAQHLAGFLVLGISPRLQFDDPYRDFCELVTGQLSTAIANARAHEEERNRADTLIDRAQDLHVPSDSASTPGASERSVARILLVDDDADLRHYVQSLLVESYEIDALADGEAALATARENPPDLILSGTVMPGLDGFGLLKALRSEPHTHGIPVILLSARPRKEVQTECLEAGADDCLAKPFSAKELQACVRNLIAKKRTSNMPQRELLSQPEDMAQLTSQLTSSRQSQLQSFEALQLSEARWRAVFDHSGAGIGLTYPGGKIQAVNAALSTMLGYSESELCGLNFIDLACEGERDDNRALLAELLQGRCQYFQIEKRYRRKDGSLMWARVHVSVVWNREGSAQLVVAIIDDISERKRSERALRESERRFRMLLESIPHHVWTFRTDGTVGYWNQRLIDYTGLTSEQLRQGGWEALHPDDVERVRAAWQEARTHAMPYEVEKRIRGRDGHYRRFVCRGVPVPDEGGQVTEWFGTCTDVEDRRQSHEALQNAQAELAHVTRLTTLGELGAASIAHEVNQPLGAIVTEGHACLRWLNRAEPNLEEARAAVTRIIQGGMRASDVIGRIRSLAKKGPSEMVALDMNEAITAVLTLTKHQIDKSEILLKTELASDLRPAQGDPIQLQQVMANLIMNAIESMRPRIEGPRELLVISQNYGKEKILIQVRDSGVGIEPSRIHQIFQPFITSKPDGMGMGLPISRSIVEAHGGQLSAVPNEGAGTTFRFSLRARSAAA